MSMERLLEMHIIKIFHGSDLDEIEINANSALSEIEDIVRAQSSVLYCKEKDEYVFIIDIDTPDYFKWSKCTQK